MGARLNGQCLAFQRSTTEQRCRRPRLHRTSEAARAASVAPLFTVVVLPLILPFTSSAPPLTTVAPLGVDAG